MPLLFTHSTKCLTAEEERLATPPLVGNWLHLTGAAEVSSNQSCSVRLAIQEEAVEAARPVPLGAHFHNLEYIRKQEAYRTPRYALSASKAWLGLVFGEHVYRGMNQGQLS